MPRIPAVASLLIVSSMFMTFPAHAELSRNDLLSMPRERIVEYARFGDPEAQYWVANAIYAGIIQSPRADYKFHDWLREAAEQGHEEAAFDFHRASRNNDDLKPDARRYLELLAANNSGRANFLLYRAAYGNPDEIRLPYLLAAVETSYRQALIEYAQGGLMRAYWGVQRDLQASEAMLHEALAIPRQDHETVDDYIAHGSCQIYMYLDEIYSGRVSYRDSYGSGSELKIDSSLKNDQALVETLHAAANLSCPTALWKLASLYLDGEIVERNLPMAAALSLKVLEDEDAFYAHDSASYYYIRASIAMGNFDAAAKYIPSLGMYFDLFINNYSGLLSFRALPFCRHFGISDDGCEQYLQSLGN